MLHVILIVFRHFLNKCKTIHTRHMGAKGDWDFRISDLVKNPDGTDI